MRLFSIPALLFFAACNDTGGIEKDNNAPTTTITSHADGDNLNEGYEQTFEGTVADLNQAPLAPTQGTHYRGKSVRTSLSRVDQRLHQRIPFG